jgi:hypothetical protein
LLAWSLACFPALRLRIWSRTGVELRTDESKAKPDRGVLTSWETRVANRWMTRRNSAGLKQACPHGVFVSLTPGDPSLWSGVIFVRKGSRTKSPSQPLLLLAHPLHSLTADPGGAPFHPGAPSLPQHLVLTPSHTYRTPGQRTSLLTNSKT